MLHIRSSVLRLANKQYSLPSIQRVPRCSSLLSSHVIATWGRNNVTRPLRSLAEYHQIPPSRQSQLAVAEDKSFTPEEHHGPSKSFADGLPTVCPGCGALSQTVESDAPGFFSPQKKKRPTEVKQDEDAVFDQAMARLEGLPATSDQQISGSQLEEIEESASAPTTPSARPVCDRCHLLVHQSKGQSILHPSMDSIRSIIESSPHQRNHIYHVVDAADFPMSLIPNLISSLNLPRLRTRNRRSKSDRYLQGRTADVTFIITRSDLLAPRKEQVDRMMPYLQDVLRDALGKSGRNLRLGNVRCVSAKRGWWTPSVKEEIWKRGGAGWVVGKVNVGKSALFEVVYPKGRSQATAKSSGLEIASSDLLTADSEGSDATETLEAPTADNELPQFGSSMLDALERASETEAAAGRDRKPVNGADHDEPFDEEESTLLPPAQPETQYPQMPIVSALPGTTASPIRIPYGKGRGELIDLPGIQRSSMETHVRPDQWSSLVMKSRIIPEQYTIKPGQSLLLGGGMIRITPKTDDLVFLAYPFIPLRAHVTGTSRAVAIQTGIHDDGSQYSGRSENIATATAQHRMKSAGIFELKWDVTRLRAGPLTAKDAVGMKPENLHFTVYSTDILIESVGWVELVCQVRKRQLGLADEFPEVEVFSPKGKFVAARRPMNAWMLGGPKKLPKHLRRARPRMTISLQHRRSGGRNSASIKEPIAS